MDGIWLIWNKTQYNQSIIVKSVIGNNKNPLLASNTLLFQIIKNRFQLLKIIRKCHGKCYNSQTRRRQNWVFKLSDYCSLYLGGNILNISFSLTRNQGLVWFPWCTWRWQSVRQKHCQGGWRYWIHTDRHGSHGYHQSTWYQWYFTSYSDFTISLSQTTFDISFGNDECFIYPILVKIYINLDLRVW